MGYCFVTTEKIKLLGTLTSKYMHNHRKVTVENADPNLYHLNEELVALPLDEYWKQKTYTDFLRSVLKVWTTTKIIRCGITKFMPWKWYLHFPEKRILILKHKKRKT